MSFIVIVLQGQGCDHCEVGSPITRVESPAGVVRLCLECEVFWFREASGTRGHRRAASVAPERENT